MRYSDLIVEQQSLRRAGQTRQSLPCLNTQRIDIDEDTPIIRPLALLDMSA